MKTKKILSLVLAVLLLFGTMSVTAFAGDDDCATCGGDGLVGDNNDETCAVCGGTGKLAYLDLDETSDNKGVYPNNKTIDQNYTFTESGITYTDVTKVKLDWTISDIAATYTSTKTWKPDTMTWDETKTAGTTTNGGATFTLTNLSSVKVNASASFKAESGFTPETVKIGGAEITADANGVYTGSAVTIGTVVKDDKTVDATIDHDETITAAITPGDNDFASLAADSGKYGTYTVTISEVPTVTWKPLSATVQGSTVYYFPVLGGTNPQPDKFAYSTDGVTFTEIEKPDGGYTMTGDVATYAKAGQLYYSGGSVNTVRSVNDISWNDTFADNSGSSYPYHASNNYVDLQAGIKAKIASDGSETVEKIVMVTSGYGSDSEVPKINGVSLTDIWNAYKDGSSGFGGSDGAFMSCVAADSTYVDFYYCNIPCWREWYSTTSNSICALISRTFTK